MRRLFGQPLERAFPGSALYWEGRYRGGGTSGHGSYGYLAEFKARVLNAFVEEQKIQSVVELGCGDGNQLALARYPAYLGLDVSETAVELCRRRFAGDPTKTFRCYGPGHPAPVGGADLALSLDVVYHLVEDDVYARYLGDLCAAAKRFVIVYSTNRRQWLRRRNPHVRHRRFVDDVVERGDYRLVETVRNPHRHRTRTHRKRGKADFFIFQRC